ncbi:DotU family type IV/VI secretion system protein [Candidatus Bealeia paramacronuclearis]|uniref:DotU family type IV/VI secretion system protein n=1 Tax=Candidatus Bealeia paramacronuclearis TaxID=1921001 RepID=A0ABZ2CAE0_9PROT|nr:DotU family type IV/VI secretion system protein [Candidatus Bealeia paramacronuclearis]
MQGSGSYGLEGYKESSASYVYACFESFYCELLRNKQRVLTKAWLQPDASDQEVTPDIFANSLLEKFQIFLENQEEHLFGRNLVGILQTLYEETKYAMVVLADEVFLNLDWPGQHYWEDNLLEQRIYGTHSGGQVFFEKIEALLKRDNPAWKDVARVYLAALGLGLRGQYHSRDDAGVIQNYSSLLFAYINHHDSQFSKGEGYNLCPQAGQETLSGLRGKDLPDARNWYIIFSAIGLLYLLSSSLIWYFSTSDINDLVERILTNASHSQEGGEGL